MTPAVLVVAVLAAAGWAGFVCAVIELRWWIRATFTAMERNDQAIAALSDLNDLAAHAVTELGRWHHPSHN